MAISNLSGFLAKKKGRSARIRKPGGRRKGRGIITNQKGAFGLHRRELYDSKSN